MSSNRAKHIEGSSQQPKGVGQQRPPCSSQLPARESSAPSARMEKPALGDPSSELMEAIVDSANMERAWKQVRSNRGGPGPDGVTLKQFANTFREQWPAIKDQLLEGTYQPSPARRKSIPKPDGSQRHLGIPNVQDRLIQQAILQVLTPMFDPDFSESSFGFRPGRSAHGAIKQVQAHIRSGYRYVVDMDLSKFFDRVQHDVLMARVARKVRDKRLLRLIGRYLRSGILSDNQFEPTPEGTMQGGPLSPLLANILLDDFDKELERRGHLFVRYADDFLVFTKTGKASERVMGSVSRYLTEKLKLQVNTTKSKTCPAHGLEFLGFRFQGHGGTPRVSDKNVKRLKSTVREITRPHRGVSIEHRLKELRPRLRGWIGYFGLSPIVTPFRNLDYWIRRRLRSCIWRSWRRARTRIRNLKRLGIAHVPAVLTGSSSKGPWRLSRSLAVKHALNNGYLAQLGLVSLLDLWQTLAPKLRTA